MLQEVGTYGASRLGVSDEEARGRPLSEEEQQLVGRHRHLFQAKVWQGSKAVLILPVIAPTSADAVIAAIDAAVDQGISAESLAAIRIEVKRVPAS